MPFRRWLAGATPAAVTLGLLLTATPASAALAPDYEMPFPCAQQWTGTSRATHSPSPDAIDFNRTDDLGALLVAAAPGTVSRVADLGDVSYGLYIIVDHGNGSSTLYAHLQSVLVVLGQRVDQGTVLGHVGDSGGVTGAHLHFEERVSGTDQPAWFHQTPFVMGTTQASANCPQVPVTGNWNASRASEVGTFARTATGGVFRLATSATTTEEVRFGRSVDLPITGDWNGDGRTDLGVKYPGARKFRLRHSDGTVTTVLFGGNMDRPVTGDWNGDGRTDIGIWHPATAAFRLRADDGTVLGVRLGSVGSQPVTGDWNGDGITDLGVFDQATATFTLRTVGADGTTRLAYVTFGSAADLPVTGDWNGDGRTDVGVWSPATATYSLRTALATGATTVRSLRFGAPR
jgi:hypothetical protein